MKINHNMSALIANNQLLRNENSLTNSIERLSSGLKINHAADDAAGMAIATKMKTQVKGLDQASRNASDGISVLETADGSLKEVTSMLQRMRELSVQAANGTYGVDDKKAIQAEIDSLTEEVDRVSRDTEFNTKKLLDGSMDQRVYTNSRSISRIYVSDTVVSDQYKVTVERDARQAVMTGATAVGTGRIPAGTININGVEVEISEGQNLTDVYENIRMAAEEGEVNVFAVDNAANHINGSPENAGYEPVSFASGTTLVFVSDQYGSSAEMNLTCDNQQLADFLGITTQANVVGTDAVVSLSDGFGPQASCLCDGNRVAITDRNGFKMTFQTEPGIANTVFDDVSAADATAAGAGSVLRPGAMSSVRAEIDFDVTDIGTMTLQIGANEDQVMEVRIPAVSSESLYIDNVNVCSINGPGKAIDTYDKAISMVSETVSRIGAYQNRLEHAVTSLDATEENMTAALSRIEDVDMAEEMSAYTQYNVLSQAATSVLAQANDIPQQALQLLQ